MNKNLIWPALTVMVLGIIALRMLGLQTLFREPERISGPSSADAGAALTEDAQLFSQLQQAGLLTTAENSPLIELAGPDHVLVTRARHAENPDDHPLDRGRLAEEGALIDALYHSAPGTLIRAQVQLWNQAHRLVAVRDNRPAAAEDPANRWQAKDPSRPGQRRVRTGSRVPEMFGYVTGGKLQPHFSDWLAAASPDRGALVFHTTVELKKRTSVRVQVIGRPTHVSPQARIVSRCPKGAGSCARASAPAAECRFRLNAGRHRIRITVEPVLHHGPAISGLAIRRASSDQELTWRLPRHRRSGPRKHFEIKTADGQHLWDDKRRLPTPLAEQIGLLPLVGKGVRTVGALSGLLAASPLGPDITRVQLTIDSRLQALAQKVLQAKLEEYWKPSGNADPYAAERRAAVVILDTETGAILAAAGHPVPPPGLHPWDLVSIARVYPLQNPLVLRAWQGLDGNNAPGSTFKPVVALAAYQAEDETGILQRYMEGYTERQLAQKGNEAALGPDCSSYAPDKGLCYPARARPAGVRIISNFKGIHLRDAFWRNANLKSRCPKPTFSWPRDADLLGLHEAVRDSINIWFVRLADLMDGPRARAFDGNAGSGVRPAFQLVQTARMLGFGPGPYNLAFNLPDGVALDRWKHQRGRTSGDVLYGQPGQLNLMDENHRGLHWILCQNAIGQGMEASALQMARVAAGIATGRQVRPYLLARWDEEPITPRRAAKLDIGGGDLKQLRRAMKTVPETGTARAPFSRHPDKCWVYGKTGTAEVVKGKYNSAWFIGWREAENKPQRPLAFACMVTHAHGAHKTGGKVSAPIIAEILSQVR